jgi:hypothetical protein
MLSLIGPRTRSKLCSFKYLIGKTKPPFLGDYSVYSKYFIEYLHFLSEGLLCGNNVRLVYIFKVES